MYSKSGGGWSVVWGDERRERREKECRAVDEAGLFGYTEFFSRLTNFFSPLVLVRCAGEWNEGERWKKQERSVIFKGVKKSPEERKIKSVVVLAHRETDISARSSSASLLASGKPPSLYTFLRQPFLCFEAPWMLYVLPRFFLWSMDITL